MEAFNPDSPPVSPDVAYETVVSTAAKEVRYEAFISIDYIVFLYRHPH